MLILAPLNESCLIYGDIRTASNIRALHFSWLMAAMLRPLSGIYGLLINQRFKDRKEAKVHV